MQSDSWRTAQASSSERGYGYRWQQARARYLKSHPLCVKCASEDRINVGSIVDHVEPHRGDYNRFWDESNWQTLCSHCHASTKQREEQDKPSPDLLGG